MRLFVRYLLLLSVFLVASSCNVGQTTTLPKYPEYDLSLYEGKYLSIREHSIEYGLGEYIFDYVSLERDYDYYIDQYLTGTHGLNNCIPASIVMAGKWQDASFDVKVETIREKYRPRGGWFYAIDAEDAFETYGIAYETTPYETAFQITEFIDSGHIVFVILDMSHVTYNSQLEERVGAFYSNVTGHGLLIKGYIQSDKGLFFEVYDPYNLMHLYNDMSQKGKNRFYSSEEINNAIASWHRVLYTFSNE